MSGLRFAIFDVDGTLLHLEASIEAAFLAGIGAAHGVDVRPAARDVWFSGSDVDLARNILAHALGRAPTPLEVRQALDGYVARLDRDLDSGAARQPEVRGARRLLRVLAADPRWVLGLATGNCRRAAECRLRRAGLWSAFAFGAFAEDGDSKPPILEAALRRARTRWPEAAAAGRCVYLGDHPIDRRAAARSAVAFVGIGPATGGSDGLADFGDLRGSLHALARAEA